jgi:hydrogenase maturation protease
MNPPRILVACIGNIFMGDDAFGVEVARRLAPLHWPPGVHVEDFGIRGIDLAYSLLGGYEAAVFVDAVQRGQPPGTLHVIEPDLAELNSARRTSIDAHTMDPATVLRSAAAMGPIPPRILLVGCEPGPLPGEDEMQMELSPPVAAALDEAVRLVQEIVAKIIAGPRTQHIESTKEMSSCFAKSVQ